MSKRTLTDEQADAGLEHAYAYLQSQMSGIDNQIAHTAFDSLMDSEAEATDFCQKLVAMSMHSGICKAKADRDLFAEAFRTFCLIHSAHHFDP